jgi:hypothetical protein
MHACEGTKIGIQYLKAIICPSHMLEPHSCEHTAGLDALLWMHVLQLSSVSGAGIRLTTFAAIRSGLCVRGEAASGRQAPNARRRRQHRPHYQVKLTVSLDGETKVCIAKVEFNARPPMALSA